MPCTGGTRSAVRHPARHAARHAARTAALVAVLAALVTGGAHAAGLTTAADPAPAVGSAEPATLVVALPRIGASNRAW